MTTTLLQLDNCVFPEVTVEANPFYVPQEEGKLDISPEIASHVLFREPNRLFANVSIDLEDPEDVRPYVLNLRAFGVFTLPENIFECDQDLMERKVAHYSSNAATLVYGAAREFVASITARAPHGVFFLPTRDESDLNINVALPEEMRAPVKRIKKKSAKRESAKKKG